MPQSQSLDSDLYDDIYGEGENEYAVLVQDSVEDEEQEQFTPSLDASKAESSSSANKPQGHSLPAKPLSPGPRSSALSYSAQIAQQFSVYQQTPSQERQQRAEIPLPPNPRISASGAPGPSAIATHEGTGGRASLDRPIRPSEMKDEGKMFVGGLNWDTTDEGLRKYFSEFGKVDACTILRDPDGRSRGFAFLTFEEASSVNAVMVREHYLDGKAIDPKRAIPREEHLRNTRYFLGGLSPATTSDSMREFFSAYGKVVDATVMVDRETGRSKGFGFVTFEDASNADQLVGKAGLILDDKQIEVKMAQPRSQRDAVRNTPNSNREPFFNDRDSRTPSASTQFPIQQPNTMPMLYQRMMGQVPMMGNGMPVMNMNPMAIGMAMNGYQPPMGGGMHPGAVNGLNLMNPMNPMGMGLRLGMGSMGGVGIGPVGMSGGMMGGGNMHGMGMSMGAMNGPGPSRITNRGQHHFHPYARR